MRTPVDLRTSDRLPIGNRVQLLPRGRVAICALAINIGLGGVLLEATPSLPIGSACALEILPVEGSGGRRIVAEGSVIRNDANGTAIRFSKVLERNTLSIFRGPSWVASGSSMLNAYLTYLKVGQSGDREDCERLLGISIEKYRTIFISTFFSCIALAILPVWVFYGNLPSLPVWGNVTASFVYGAFWLGIMQPVIDLFVIRIIKRQST